MYQVKIDDILITVDEETAEQLTDPDYAAKYISAVKEQLLQEPTESEEKSKLWKSPKCPTEEEATLALLMLRRSFEDDFCNKKTPKNDFWLKIALKMNETGFYVGEGVEAREKVRQKFWNLQSSYMKYIDSQKRTGEGSLKRPKYFDELNDILGMKHKIKPVLIIESGSKKENRDDFSKPSTSRLNTSLSEDDSTKPDSGNSPSTSRFEAIKKSVRPKSNKQDALKELLNIQKENQQMRREEFSSMMTMFQSQSEQRNKQTLLLIEKLGEKKRKRSSSSDS